LSNGSNSYQYKTFLQSLVSSSTLALTFSNFSLSTFFSDLKSKNLVNFKFSPTLSLYDGKTTKFSITQKIPFLGGTQSINGSNNIKNETYKYNDVGTTIDINNVSIVENSVYFNIVMKYEYI